VGYAIANNIDVLPKLKPSILTSIDPSPTHQLTEAAIQKMNFLYAKEYSMEKDLSILIRTVTKLGN
jgi:hypothetical protein